MDHTHSPCVLGHQGGSPFTPIVGVVHCRKPQTAPEASGKARSACTAVRHVVAKDPFHRLPGCARICCLPARTRSQHGHRFCGGHCRLAFGSRHSTGGGGRRSGIHGEHRHVCPFWGVCPAAETNAVEVVAACPSRCCIVRDHRSRSTADTWAGDCLVGHRCQHLGGLGGPGGSQEARVHYPVEVGGTA